ncbi:hypothetical protein HPB52_023212 [Rhipicephalus sanguineus]|uniref:Uncharacterized protein n=1 Tax=Rhipicephalus sanguineus TaxID=34632 RepID=A0A9D4QEM0_RHISA|nr:hypothetical protein HPB52_023212 [Rhipicephalus sanguineus]
MSSTSLPGPSSGPENHIVPSAGASDEPSMDFQETQVDFTTQRHETPLAHKAAQDNDGNWNIVMRKRSKKQLNKESVSLHQASCQEKNANKPLCNKEEASQGFRARNSGKPPIRRKLPPLPKSDIKVIIRPKKGLLVSNYNNHDIARSIVAACGDPHKCKDGDILTRLRHGSNIIIVSTPSEQAADAIRKLDKINLQGQMHEVNAYVAAPEGVSKGVIHGVDRGTTSEELLAHLRVRTQGVKILHARMLGQTKTAVITFDGDFVPRYVNYYGGEEPCYPYKPTKQVCKVCNRLGHRSDVCPHPENPACERCGTENPEQDHTCELQCALCGEAHLTGDTHCKKKLKPIRRHVPRSAQKHTGTAGRRKWFSSDKDFDSSGNELEATKRQPRSLSRSQSAGNEFTTTEDDTSSTSSAPTAKKMKKKKTKKASRKTADHQNPPSSHELSELAAATMITQRERLSQTVAGRDILKRVGIPPYPQHVGKELEELDPSDRDHLYVAPLPRNMHPERHKGRRRARTAWLRALLRRLNREDVYYVDVASYRQPLPLKKRHDHQNFVAVDAASYLSQAVQQKHGRFVECALGAPGNRAAEQRADHLAVGVAPVLVHRHVMATLAHRFPAAANVPE